MNVDTKIASKAIALRLKKVILKLIHCDQTAYVNNRYIGESNRVISDMLEYMLRMRFKQSNSQLILRSHLILSNIHSFLQLCNLLDLAQTLFSGSKHFCIRQRAV